MAELTPPTRDLISRAEALADEMGHDWMGSEHLLLAITEADDDLAARRILNETGAATGRQGVPRQAVRPLRVAPASSSGVMDATAEPLVAEAAHLLHDGEERAPLVRQRVLDARG